MLVRCYDSKFQRRQPTYIGCLVHKDWLSFSNFRSWMERQDWKGKFLDKDILGGKSRVYSPDNCVFIDRSLNNLLTLRGNDRGELLLGVKLDKRSNKFESRCNYNGKSIALGTYSSELEAHKAYMMRKIAIIREFANKASDKRIEMALLEIADEFQSKTFKR